MQQITEWLEKLGLSEYAQRFAENGIDPDDSLRPLRHPDRLQPNRATPQHAALDDVSAAAAPAAPVTTYGASCPI